MEEPKLFIDVKVEKDDVFSPPEGIPLDRAIKHDHSKIPPSTLRRWHAHMKSFSKAGNVASEVAVGTRCTGCGIFTHVLLKLVEFLTASFA